jgi:hypothetical protein
VRAESRKLIEPAESALTGKGKAVIINEINSTEILIAIKSDFFISLSSRLISVAFNSP